MAFSLRPSLIAVNGLGASPLGRCVQSKANAVCDSLSLSSNSYLDSTLLTFTHRRNRTVSAVGWSTVCFTFRLCSFGFAPACGASSSRNSLGCHRWRAAA